MVSVDEQYEALLDKIFPRDKYPIVHDKLLSFEWKTTIHHQESFREHCLNTAWFMDEYCHQRNILQDMWNSISYARLVGFCHDIGKAFAMKSTKKDKQIFTGHAQVSARLFYLRFQHEIEESILLTMVTAIDSHMCSLRNDKNLKENILRINSVMHLYLPSLDVIPILECLHKADAMGKKPEIIDENPAYLPESSVSYRKNNKIAIFLIGPSGSGKSTLAATLEAQLSSLGSVKHLERDAVLMEFALEGESYDECRKRVYENIVLKRKFQERWKTVLSTTDSQIVLIDTVQNYYHMYIQNFYHHFRIGLYCVPLNFFDSSLHGKAPRVEFPPQKWAGYPSVMTETLQKKWQLEIGTGVWQTIPPLVKRYLDRCKSLSLEQQPTIATLWNKYSGPEPIAAHFSPMGIYFSTQYSVSNVEIIRASYMDLSDVTYGPTRYYRGEYILKTPEGVSMLRSGLPTFRKEINMSDSFQKIVATPKYDGCLINILYVPKEYKHFQWLQNRFPEAYYEKYGLLFIGSKNTLLMLKCLRKRFDVAIGMEFKDFIASYSHHFQDKMMTLHFEAMVEKSYEELTVYYPQNFCKFLGYTTFTDATRTFTLPEPSEPRAVEQMEFDNLQECQEYMEGQHQKLLDGDVNCEPEGFVLYVYENGLKDIVKTKFGEYYVAHKPERHPEEFKRLLSNPKLTDRFQKCRFVKMNGLYKANKLIEKIREMLPESNSMSRKEFGRYLEDSNCLDLQLKMDVITLKFGIKKIKLERVFWKYFPDKNAMVQEIQNAFNIFS